MKHDTWTADQNEVLKKEHGISFEDVVFHIGAGDAAAISEHPNQRRYPGQRMLVVMAEDYARLVAFVESVEEIFLNTIIPGRKATKQYMGDSDG